VNAITEYFHKKHLIINAQKTQLLLFNPGGRLANIPGISVDNQTRPWDRRLTYLGVVLDPVQQQTTVAARMLYSLVGRRSPLLPETKLILFKT